MAKKDKKDKAAEAKASPEFVEPELTEDRSPEIPSADTLDAEVEDATAAGVPEPEKCKYVAIRRCFDFGRSWKPQRESVREKDYLLVVGADVEVDKKNFMRVKAAPEPEAVAEAEGIAVSEFKADEFLD